MARSGTQAQRSTFISSPAQLLWGASTLAVMVALATAAAWQVYESSRLPLVGAVGFAIGLGSTLLGAWLRWRWWAIGLLAFGAYTLAVVPVAIPTAMTGGERIARGAADGIAGIVLGWKQLLTITLPAGEYQAVLVPFLVTVTVCCLTASALMVFAPRRASWAVLPMLAMVAFGSLFGPSTSSEPLTVGLWTVADGRHVSIGFLAVAVCAVWLLGNARMERARAMKVAQSRTGTARLGAANVGFALRRYALAATLATVAVVGALIAAPVATAFGPRHAPRDTVDPVLLVQQQPSPLADYRAWYNADAYEAVLFSVDGAADTQRLRIATLDNYDGETFHVSPEARFFRQPQTQAGGITITVGDGYRGVWVPLATVDGGAPSFSGPRAELLADAYYASMETDMGVVVIPGSASSEGLRAGDTYTIATAAAAGTEALNGTQGGDPRVSPEDYPQLAAWVEQQAVGRSGADVVELVGRLVERGYLSHSARESQDSVAWTSELEARANYSFQGNRPGHSAARVDELFEAMLSQERRAGEFADAQALVAAVGDDEQFATAAALLGAYLGFDSRVVLGVRLGATGSDLGVKPCESTCTGGNLTVWAEVRSPGGEWATLDATPQFELAPLLIQEGQTPPENPTEPEQVAANVVEPPAVSSDSSAAAAEPTPVEEDWLAQYLPLIITIAVVTVGGALLLVPLLVFPLAKRSRRRWRRRTSVPEVAMVGAWHELVDMYVDYGIEIPRGLTRAELADVLERPAATTIAAVVDRAVFAEHPPAREASEATWQMLDDERRTIAAALPWTRRLRAAFTPASLRRAAREDQRVVAPTLMRKDRHARL